MACRHDASAGAGILALINVDAEAVVVLLKSPHAPAAVVRPLCVDALTVVAAAEVSILDAFVNVEGTVVTTPQERSCRLVVEALAGS